MKTIALIRPEENRDKERVEQLLIAAFQDHPHSNQTEHLLVAKLREAGALTLSLVAELEGDVVGHIAFSAVTMNDQKLNWYGLAPVAVAPEYQNQGIGTQLVKQGLQELQKLTPQGCVLLGEPEFYGRFGFKPEAKLVLAGMPPEYFLALPFEETVPQGEVKYHPVFAEFS